MNIKESGEQFCYLLQPILINIIEGAEVFAVNIQYGKKKMKNCHFHRNISILSIFFRTFAPSIKIKKIQFFK